VAGTVVGTSLPATLHVLVYVNMVQNAGFEDGLAQWTVTDPSAATGVMDSAPDAHGDTHSFHWWSASAFTFTVGQTIDGLDPATTYVFSLWASGLAGSKLQAFATCGGTTVTADITNTGWGGGGNWIQYTIGGLTGATSCTVGVSANAAAGDWGNLDDFQFHPQ
jgi:arabinogalactan endo-1,4-beta-galactosidase